MGANVSSVHDVHSSMETNNGLVVEIESRRQWKSLFDSMKGSNKLVYITRKLHIMYFNYLTKLMFVVNLILFVFPNLVYM